MSGDEVMQKILILGGANQHIKFVEAAKRLGVETYVADYLATSEAKKMADHALKIDINDIDALAAICKENNIQGVVSGWLDPCQVPYFKLCRRLGVPCYGTEEQFKTLTNKKRFKEICRAYEVDVIEDYEEDDLDSIQYPVFVKPSVSRGSRGQSVAENKEEIIQAVERARKQSSDNKVIIERDMTGCRDISVTYFFVNGIPYLERLSDRYLGEKKDGLENVASGTVSPSSITDMYLKKVDKRVKRMLTEIGIKNGPVFMQGFVENNTVRFYDPGFRFPGGEYERAVKKLFGLDFAEMLIEFALTGDMNSYEDKMPENLFKLNGNIELIHDISLRKGEIGCIAGLEDLEGFPEIISLSQRYFVGNTVPHETNVVRRFLEINSICQNVTAAKRLVNKVNEVIMVKDVRGDNMVISQFKPFEK